MEIISVLFDEPGTEFNDYERYVSFLCTPLEDAVEKVGKETDSSRRILNLFGVQSLMNLTGINLF